MCKKCHDIGAPHKERPGNAGESLPEEGDLNTELILSGKGSEEDLRRLQEDLELFDYAATHADEECCEWCGRPISCCDCNRCLSCGKHEHEGCNCL